MTGFTYILLSPNTHTHHPHSPPSAPTHTHTHKSRHDFSTGEVVLSLYKTSPEVLKFAFQQHFLFMVHTLSPGHWAEGFTYVISFNRHNKSVTWVVLPL